MRAAEERVVGNEAERHELRDPPGPLLKLANDLHVLRQLPGLLDVTEHHGRGRAQAGPVAGLDDLDPACDRQLVGRNPRPDSIVENLSRGPRGRAEAALLQVVEHRLRAAPRAFAHVVDLHGRVGMKMDLGCSGFRPAQPLAVMLEGVVRVNPALHADLGRAELHGLVNPLLELSLIDFVGFR